MLAIESAFPQFMDIDGTPINNGQLYFGVVNLNPETNPITVYWDAAGTQPASQPIQTINGYAVRNGSPASIFVNSDYSLNVRNGRGNLVFYAPTSKNPVIDGTIPTAASTSKTVDAINAVDATGMTDGITIIAKGRSTVGDGGGGLFRYVASSVQAADGGTVFAPTAGSGRFFRDGWTSTGFTGPLQMEWFGAIGDGITTGQQAVFALALAAAPTGGAVVFSPGKTYLWSASTPVSKKLTIFGNGAVIKFDPAYNVSGGTLEAFSVSGDDVTFEGIYFDATGAPSPSNNSRFVWSTAARTTIRECSAKNLPGGTANVQVAFGSSITSSFFTVESCRFDSCPGAAFSQGIRPMFMHNRVNEPTDVSFAINSTNCVGGQVIGNNIYNTSGSVSGHILAEEGASQWVITDNYVRGVKNGIGIGAANPSVTTVVEGGIISNNIIDGAGMTSTAPSSLISIPIYYSGVQIINNQMRGMPAGLSGNRAVVVPMRGTMVRGNYIDCTTGTGALAAATINPVGSAGDIYWFDNETICSTGPSRHILADNGSAGGGKLHIKGGRFIGASEGVNFNLSSPTNIVLAIENISEMTSTSLFAVTTAYPAFGSRQTFFNSHGAIRQPHSIKTGRTVMYGNAAPTSGDWQQGDEVISTGPMASTTDRWRCVADGTPGVWKSGAALSA